MGQGMNLIMGLIVRRVVCMWHQVCKEQTISIARSDGQTRRLL